MTTTATGVSRVPEKVPDEVPFADLFYGHAARMVRLATLLGAEDPEDVVQEAFCKVYAARRRLQHDRDVVAYLNRTVVNEVRSRHRRVTTARAKLHLLVPEVVAPSPDSGDNQAVLEALARLPHRRREALVLRFWLDLPLAEIAEAMGVQVGTVKSLISRGLDALATDLEVER